MASYQHWRPVNALVFLESDEGHFYVFELNHVHASVDFRAETHRVETWAEAIHDLTYGPKTYELSIEGAGTMTMYSSFEDWVRSKAQRSQQGIGMGAIEIEP